MSVVRVTEGTPPHLPSTSADCLSSEAFFISFYTVGVKKQHPPYRIHPNVGKRRSIIRFTNYEPPLGFIKHRAWSKCAIKLGLFIPSLSSSGQPC